MATVTLARAGQTAAPRSFTPPGDRSARLSHLDPRPLWREDAAVESPWRSPTFWLAWALVAPVMGVAKLVRRIG